MSEELGAEFRNMPPEFRCTEATATKIKEQNPPPLAWAALPLSPVLGIPLYVSSDVPEGKLQFWDNGELKAEVDV